MLLGTDLDSVTKAVKKRGPNKDYHQLDEYNNLEEARLDLKTKLIKGFKLVYFRNKHLKNYSKVEYICKKGCPVVLYLKLHPDSQKVTSFIIDENHKHVNDNANLLPTETLNKVIDLINTGITDNFKDIF